MSGSRRSALTAVAFRIALRLREIAKPYFDRDETVPRDLLAKEFRAICDAYRPRHGGPLTTEEMQVIANKWVPRAIAQMDRREQTKEGLSR